MPNPFTSAADLAHYLGTRLREQSTWNGFAIAVLGGAVAPSPYSWAAIFCGVAKVLVPDQAA